MPEVTRERALSRLRLLEPHLEQGQSLLTVAKEAGVPFRTAGRLSGEALYGISVT